MTLPDAHPFARVRTVFTVLVAWWFWWVLPLLVSGAPRWVEIAGWFAFLAFSAFVLYEVWLYALTDNPIPPVIFPGGNPGPLASALLTIFIQFVVITAVFAWGAFLFGYGDLVAAIPAEPGGSGNDLPDAAYTTALELFVWHSFAVVPFLELPNTVNWDEPVAERAGLLSLVLLVYRGLFLTPLFIGLRKVWPVRAR